MKQQLIHGGSPLSDDKIVEMWKNLSIEEIVTKSKAEAELITAFSESHVNGGLMIHKFRIEENEVFNWFASRNRLDEIYFTRKILNHSGLLNYRNAIKATQDFKVKNVQWASDILDIAGLIARINFYGGAYGEDLDAKEAWKVANHYLLQEYDSRFDEVCSFTYELEGADWFFGIMWDTSFQLFDKSSSTLYIFDITDTD